MCTAPPKTLRVRGALAVQNKYQFQWWAVSLVNAVPFGGMKKGADGGIDGHIYLKVRGKVAHGNSCGHLCEGTVLWLKIDTRCLFKMMSFT
jgi:hypothetical protein